jgi:supervillin
MFDYVLCAVLGTTHFAQEALAGLASKEDFTNVALRKTDMSSRSATSEHLPYTELMLLHVKGELV